MNCQKCAVGQCWSHVTSAPGVLEEVDDPESPSGVDASCASWIVSEMAPEASLDHDVRAARKMLGDSAVMLTQLGTEYWRVRLLVKVQHQNLSTPLGVNIAVAVDVAVFLKFVLR